VYKEILQDVKLNKNYVDNEEMNFKNKIFPVLLAFFIKADVNQSINL